MELKDPSVKKRPLPTVTPLPVAPDLAQGAVMERPSDEAAKIDSYSKQACAEPWHDAQAFLEAYAKEQEKERDLRWVKSIEDLNPSNARLKVLHPRYVRAIKRVLGIKGSQAEIRAQGATRARRFRERKGVTAASG